MSGMTGPAVSMARARLGGLIAVACAVLGGCAMVTATGVLAETGIRSHASVERFSDAEVLVSAPQSVERDEDLDVALPGRVPVPAGVASRVSALPGVADAVGDVSFPAAIVDLVDRVGGVPTGHGWRSMRVIEYELTGTEPRTPDAVVLDDELAAPAGLEPGDSVEMVVNGVREDYRVSGVVEAAGSGVYFAQRTAREFARSPGSVDLVAVSLAPGAEVDQVTDRIRAGLNAAYDTELLVTTGAARGDVESLEAGAGRGVLVALAASLGGTVVLIVGFIVAGALAVSVANQRRDLALLRAIGSTPVQVRRLIATQASVVSLLVMPFGIGAGYLLAGGFADLLTSSGMLPLGVPIVWSPFPALVSIGLLLGVVQVAARAAAMRTSRAAATEAVAESRTEPRPPGMPRTVVGCVLIGLSTASTVVPLVTRTEAAFVSAGSGTILAFVGLALVAPALVRILTSTLLGRLRPDTPAPIWLAISNSHGYARRTAGAVSVLALAIGLTIVQVFTHSTLAAVIVDERSAGDRVDVTVSAAGVGGLSERDRQQIAAQPGVSAAVPLTATSVVHPSRERDLRSAETYPALALNGAAPAVLDVGVSAGDLSDLRGDTVALASTLAWLNDLEVGERMDLILADGTAASPTVVATYDRGFGFGKVLVSTDLLHNKGVGPPMYDAVLVDGSDDVLAGLRGWSRNRPSVELRSGSTSVLGAGSSTRTSGPVDLVVSLALLGYVLLGVSNGLVASTARRRAELGALRLIGTTPEQIRRMIRGESALMCAIAVMSGLLLSLIPMTLLSIGLLGLPWPQGPLWMVPAIALLVCGVAYLATSLPTRKALTLLPTGALRDPD